MTRPILKNNNNTIKRCSPEYTALCKPWRVCMMISIGGDRNRGVVLLFMIEGDSIAHNKA